MRSNRGMGLVIVILIVIGVSLAATSIFVSVTLLQNGRAVAESKETLRKIALGISSANVEGVAQSSRHYEQDVGALPDALADLLAKPAAVAACALDNSTRQLAGWCGPYWTDMYSGQTAFVDGWGRGILYNKAGRSVRSMGENGVDNNGASDDITQTF